MRKFVINVWRNLVLDSHGAEIAEAAFVLPIMFMVLIGIFWFGQAYSLYGTITRAAQEGARAGAAPYCTTCTNPNGPAVNASNAVNAALTIANIDTSQVRWPTSHPALPNCVSGGSALSCNGVSPDPGHACVQLPAELVVADGTGAGVCGVSVSFRYPFQFYLPYTSLNKRQIWLTASASARMETQ